MKSPPLDVYCLAVGGTGMAPLACLLRQQGHRVRGVDGPLYPPMSTLLERAGIRPLTGYDPAHLDPPPDLVVVGNAIRRDNPEAVEAERRGLPLLSMPQALARFFLAGRRPLVVAGTHGKTTTTALAAWVWTACGRDPGYLIGGAPLDLPASFASGGGDRFVIEGDEYNAAYFDRGPKFLHYRPETLILTSVEYDHADLYPTPEALRAAFAQLLALLPPDGCLVACGDDPAVRELAVDAPCPVVFYGLGEENVVRPGGPVVAAPEGSRFRIEDPEAGTIEVHLPLAGAHNVANALAVWAAARRDGIPARAVAAALGRFHGVRRRLDELGTAEGVTVVDDFAHHPTAVAATLGALRQRYPGRRLVVLFEPRSLTAGRRMFFDPYRAAFADADRVLFAPTFHSDRLAPEDRLDFGALARELSGAGVPAALCMDAEEVLSRALAEAGTGDVLVTMSSGAFEGLPHRLVEGLAARVVAG
ncbi:MAG TPA: Mur ligase family protein [Thermoanaerobaculia bacterium]|nr:Mur ligase family protein [Thermoanaerobaculia bacterium]